MQFILTIMSVATAVATLSALALIAWWLWRD
jgi:hypothetical protein